LEFYYKRKDFLIKKLNEELKVLSNKARFIEMIVEGKLKINNVPKNKIIASLEDKAFDKINDSYSYLLSMPIHTLTKEKYEELLYQQHNKEVELEKIKKMNPKEMYIKDLTELKVLIKKNYAK
jgi:DNA topoisomerase-2